MSEAIYNEAGVQVYRVSRGHYRMFREEGRRTGELYCAAGFVTRTESTWPALALLAALEHYTRSDADD